MADLAVDDQSGSEVDESEIGIGLLLPTNKEAAETIKPGMSDFHDPATRWVSGRVAGWGQRLGRARLGRDMGRKVMGLGSLPTGVIVIAPVQGQMPRGRLDVVYRIGHQGRIKQRFQLLHIVPVGAGDHHADRDTLAVGQQVAFGAGFAPVGRVAPRGERLTGPPFLPSGALVRHPSAACQVNSRPTRSS